jgi:hyperosmotically inducible protein
MTKSVLRVIRYIIPALVLLAAVPVSMRAATSQVIEKAKDAVVKSVTIAAEKTKDGLSKSGEVMTDEWITARVHQRFVGDDLLNDSDISVDSSHHVVTLTGTVIGLSGRSRATRIAIDTEGVQRVVNRLTIGPKQKTKT